MNNTWKTGTPDQDGQYLVYYGKPAIYGKSEAYHEILILTWNSYYKVWDDEEGDDFFCKPDQVSHWMELPEAPQED